ncbi:MAG: hypothetical protein ACPGTS_00935 [Minisyncoccia bacterium]
MKKHLEKVKNRPLEDRKKMATFFAIGTTLLVVLLWLILLSVFKQPKQTTPSTTGLEPLKEAFETVGQELSEINTEANNTEIIPDELQIMIDVENETQANLDLNTESENQIQTESQTQTSQDIILTN